MEYIPAKTIVTKNKSAAWFGAEYNMNIYRGCVHGCIYCDSRSSCYHIEDFDTVKAKENALEIIRNDISRKVKTGVVSTGAMSDPYNPFEKKELLTRNALELLNAYNFGVAIATKSNLITRDIDILQDISKQAPVICKITITSVNDELCEKIEPGAPNATKRFEAIRHLSSEGLFTGILLMPVLPFIEDSEDNILKILEKARINGAKFIYPMFGVTLRDNQRMHFYKKLDELFPNRNYAEKYAKYYKDTYACYSPNAKNLVAIFNNYCNEHGILYKMHEIVRAYKSKYESEQLNFFI